MLYRLGKGGHLLSFFIYSIVNWMPIHQSRPNPMPIWVCCVFFHKHMKILSQIRSYLCSLFFLLSPQISSSPPYKSQIKIYGIISSLCNFTNSVFAAIMFHIPKDMITYIGWCRYFNFLIHEIFSISIFKLFFIISLLFCQKNVVYTHVSCFEGEKMNRPQWYVNGLFNNIISDAILTSTPLEVLGKNSHPFSVLPHWAIQECSMFSLRPLNYVFYNMLTFRKSSSWCHIILICQFFHFFKFYTPFC